MRLLKKTWQGKIEAYFEFRVCSRVDHLIKTKRYKLLLWEIEQMVKTNDLVLLGACNHPDTTWDKFIVQHLFLKCLISWKVIF